MDGEKPREEGSSLYKVLSNPHRRRIIEMIGPEGRTGFTELREDLGMSVGALYHHIDALNGLITQDEQHKYVLTRQGKQAYKLMIETSDQLSSNRARGKQPNLTTKPLTGIAEIFYPKTLLLSVSDKPVLHIPLAVIIVAFGAWVATRANLRFVLVFPDSQTTISPSLGAVFFIVSWLVLFGLCDLLSTFVFGRKGGDLSLLVGSSVAFLPMILFSGLWYLLKTIRFDTSGMIVPVLLVLFQLWTIVVLSCATSLSKGLRIERSALISFTVAYINIVFFLFLQIYK
jgi:DNA-binding transcriptional ArsR family regulator